MISTILNERVRITRVLNAVAAGTSDQTSSAVDMQADGGYEGVMFIGVVGTLTAGQATSMHATQSSDDGDTDNYSDIEGTSLGSLDDADSNAAMVLDVYRPTKRYVKCVLDRATQNAVIDGIIAIQYNPRSTPTTHDSTTVALSEAHVSPDEGTA